MLVSLRSPSAPPAAPEGDYYGSSRAPSAAPPARASSKSKAPSALVSWFAPPGRRVRKAPVIGSRSTTTTTPLPPSLPPAFVGPPMATSYPHNVVTGGDADEVVTLTGFLGTEGSNVDVDLVVLMTHIQAACKHIASILASPTELQVTLSGKEAAYGAGRDAPKPLDIVSVGLLSTAWFP